MNKMAEFIKFFQDYNTHTNLMSKNDVQLLETKHIPDSLSIYLFFEKYAKDAKNLIDVGTGGGLPAIPIALKYDKINVYALDSIAKKIRFIEDVKIQMKIDNIFPVCKRIEDFDKRDFFDVAVSRAVSSLPTLLEYCTPFVKKNGYIVAYKSSMADDELDMASNAVKILNLKFIEKIRTDIGDSTERNLLVFQKIAETSKKYPRKNNLPRKNPI